MVWDLDIGGEPVFLFTDNYYTDRTDCYLAVYDSDGNLIDWAYQGGTLTVESGTVVTAQSNIYNDGTSTGYCIVYLRDVDTGYLPVESDVIQIDQGKEGYPGGIDFTADSDMVIEYEVWWTDSNGNAKESSPDDTIGNYTVAIGDVWISMLALMRASDDKVASTVYVGESYYMDIVIKNTTSSDKTITVTLSGDYSEEISGITVPGGGTEVSFSTNNFVFDTTGSKTINVEMVTSDGLYSYSIQMDFDVVEKDLPDMVIDTTNTYVEVNGTEVSTGTHTVKEGDTISYYCKACNEGGSGECYILIMDEMGDGEQLDEVRNTIDNGTCLILGESSFDITQDRELKFYAGHTVDGGNVTDTLGC